MESTSLISSNVLENLLTINVLNMQNNIKDAIKDKFLCPQKFAQDIEHIVKVSKITYIDAIITYCEENSIELETVPKLISKPLKEKIKCEATRLNFLKKTSRATLKF
jgi:hypothetical protein